jgi:cytochrome c553
MIERRFSFGVGAALVCAAFAFANPASADDIAKGSAEAGATKAAVCTACHGVNGNSTNPEWPVLAGQNAAYLREQLAMFKSKKRNNPIMFPIIEPLNELIEEAKIEPVVAEAFPFDRAGDAHQMIADRKNIGKVVLVP